MCKDTSIEFLRSCTILIALFKIVLASSMFLSPILTAKRFYRHASVIFLRFGLLKIT